MQLFVTVDPHVLTVFRQQTPNPDAQLPSWLPPWLVHSVDVRQVPISPLDVVQASCLKVTTLKMEKRPSRLLCRLSDLDLRPSMGEVRTRVTVSDKIALVNMLIAGYYKADGQGTLTSEGSQRTGKEEVLNGVQVT